MLDHFDLRVERPMGRLRREVPLQRRLHSTVLAGDLIVLGTGACAQTEPFLTCHARNPTWYECIQDGDCALTSNACGWPTESVNRRFTKVAEDCNRLVGVALSCATYDPTKAGRLEATCQASTCVSTQQPLVKAGPRTTPSK